MAIGGPTTVLNNPSQLSSRLSEDHASDVSSRMRKSEGTNEQPHSPNVEDKMTEEEIGEVTDSLNDFMKEINTDIQFILHEKTNRLVVQVVDTKKEQVIKEFPPHELLDTLAAISDHIGMLLDKKV